MNALAAMNTRVKDPIYHLMISWSDGEDPGQAEAFDSVTYTMKQLGFEGHQFVAAIHRDTDNVHVHAMINRVNPESLLAVSPANDYYVMDRAMRELEIRYGRSYDRPGPYVVVERNGVKVVERAKADPNRPRRERRPQGAERMETFAGEESFYTYVRGEPRKRVVQLLKEPTLTWERLHSELATFAVELRPKGTGLAVYSTSAPDTTPVKASDLHENLSLKRLEKRLGTYVAPAVGPAPESTMPEEADNYTPHRETDQVLDRQPQAKRDPAKREARKQARAAARRDLKLRYTEYRNRFVRRSLPVDEVKARFATLALAYRAKRAEIRLSGRPTAKRKAAYSLLASRAALDRRTLQLAIEKERATLKNDPTNKPLDYREWVFKEAEAGDQAALAQLRGWHYTEKRKENESATDAPGQGTDPGMAPSGNVAPAEEPFTFDSVRPKRVLRNGAVLYWQDDDASFIDYGRIVRMAHREETRDDHILAALLFSRQKFGVSFKLTGSDEFKAHAIRLIVKHRLDVRLTDPAQRKALDDARSANAPRRPRSP